MLDKRIVVILPACFSKRIPLAWEACNYLKDVPAIREMANRMVTGHAFINSEENKL